MLEGLDSSVKLIVVPDLKDIHFHRAPRHGETLSPALANADSLGSAAGSPAYLVSSTLEREERVPRHPLF